MNWALEHVQIVIAIAVAIAAWIQKIRANAERRAKNPNRPQTQTNSPPPKRAFDAEAAERSRRIQEEIRRKIEERRRTLTRPTEPPALAKPEYDPFAPEALQRRNPQEIPRPPEPSRASSERALLLAQKLEAAKLREEKRKKRARAPEDTISIQVAPIELIPSAGPLMLVHPLRETLTNLEEVRRAIVLSEILQPPIALR